ncbi:MAG: hypothetical protein ACJ75T_07975 [Solirubrobacterales bacterium]
MISKHTFSVRGNRGPTLLISLVAGVVLSMALAATVQANFTFENYGFQMDNAPAQKVDSEGHPVTELGIWQNLITGEFKFEDIPAYEATGTFDRQAGSHPDFTFQFSLPVNPDAVVEGQNSPGPDEAVHSVDVDLPPGMIGNSTGIATCDVTELAAPGGHAKCPLASQVGEALVHFAGGSGPGQQRVGVYNIAHGPDVPALFGLNFLGNMAYINARVRPRDYGISSGSVGISQGLALTGVDLTLWGVPADGSHDGDREGIHDIDGPPIHIPDLPRIPFLSAPTSCSDVPAAFTVRGDSWENRGIFDEHTTTADAEGTPFVFEGCEKIPFAPTIDVQPSTHTAASPAGLGVDLRIPQSEDPDGLATSHLRNVKMTLPQGMTVSPSSATGLGACSLSQIGLGTNDAPACPDSAKIGKVRVETPVLADPLQGNVLLAQQSDNPFGSLLALYITMKGPGFYIKLPGKVTPDPDTGQLTVTFTDNPQVPFERLQLDLNTGPRAPLTTPSKCGTYAAETELTPWSGTAPVKLSTPITVTEGCATGGFSPDLEAGTADPSGGSFSSFLLRITQADGESNLARIRSTLPEGLLAKLKGVTLCGDAQAASGNCPADSQVGTTTIGAGAGTQPVYVPEAGKAPTAVYLGGPYKGAPYSLVVKVPAQAGPFDLGTVTVRNALQIDPITTQVTAVSDPLPQILQGIPLTYRDIRVEVNRPAFTVNPTNCEPQKVTSTLTAVTGQTASPSSPFQASGCGELGFKPKLKISLKGGTKRSDNPALTAVLKAPKGEANLAKTTVILPGSEFIDNEHINNPCTRVQFNANACPASSILGTATATSPLVDKPLTGPVYFRSNGGERELPDLVADLNGPIHVTVVGFIDTVKGRVRTRFADIPDAPVSKFTLKMKGASKGLLANSRNLCSFTPRAKVQMTGQNGKTANSSLKLGTSCGKASKRRK